MVPRMVSLLGQPDADQGTDGLLRGEQLRHITLLPLVQISAVSGARDEDGGLEDGFVLQHTQRVPRVQRAVREHNVVTLPPPTQPTRTHTHRVSLFQRQPHTIKQVKCIREGCWRRRACWPSQCWGYPRAYHQSTDTGECPRIYIHT